jgi:Zn-dependent M28 family amino/carboxypeptidase
MPFSFVTKEFNEKTGYNVLAALPGKTKANEVIVFSAHYDHVGTFSSNPWRNENEYAIQNDTIYYGANDDASGVTALILLALFFAALNNNERTLVFVAFSGEELNLAGSHSLLLEIEPTNTVVQINIEMIGRSKANKLHPFITGANLSNLKTLLNKTLYSLDSNRYGKSFFVEDPYRSENLFYRSDNLWLAKKGIPGHTIMLTSPHDIFYHSVDDEMDTIEFDILIQVIRALALGCEDIIRGTATPTRININKLQH